MPISDNGLIIISIALIVAVGIVCFTLYLKGKTKVMQEVPKGVKSISKDGQENFVESLKDSAAETIAFQSQTIETLKKEIRSLTGQVTKLKGLLYGTADPREIAEQERQTSSSTKIQKAGNTPEDIVQMRLRIMADKLKIDPMLMNFEVVQNALYDIASDPDFDKIAAVALSNQNQSTPVPQTTNDL